MIPGIPGNLAEELIQILDQFCRWKTVVLGMVFLLEDESIQAGAEDFNGRLIELFGENFRVQIAFIPNKSSFR